MEIKCKLKMITFRIGGRTRGSRILMRSTRVSVWRLRMRLRSAPTPNTARFRIICRRRVRVAIGSRFVGMRGGGAGRVLSRVAVRVRVAVARELLERVHDELDAEEREDAAKHPEADARAARLGGVFRVGARGLGCLRKGVQRVRDQVHEGVAEQRASCEREHHSKTRSKLRRVLHLDQEQNCVRST